MAIICSRGGKTGSVSGRITDRAGNLVNADTLYFWSEAPDNNYSRPIMGWGARSVKKTGYSKSTPLMSGQKYVMIATRGSKVYKREHTPVSACERTSIHVWL